MRCTDPQDREVLEQKIKELGTKVTASRLQFKWWSPGIMDAVRTSSDSCESLPRTQQGSS